jgi:hypothetical protein
MASGFRLQASGFRLQASGFRLQAWNLETSLLFRVKTYPSKNSLSEISVPSVAKLFPSWV